MKLSTFKVASALAFILLFALIVPTASAQAVITVPCGDSAALIAAITTLNGTPAADTIILAENCTYSFSTGDATNSDSALPRISSPLLIIGNNATIERATGAPEFRLMYVNSGISLGVWDTTFKNGDAFEDEDGGAIYGDQLQVLRSSFVGNTGYYGGAVYTDDNSLFIDSTFIGNSGGQGGGLYHFSGTLTLINTIFSGNTAASGGGLTNNGTATVYTSTFSGNNGFGSFMGGGISNFGTLTVNHSILWGNSTQITNSAGLTVVEYSLIEGGFTGTGNLDTDPVFVNPIAFASAPTLDGDYHLQSTSPAINAGSSAALPLDLYDLDGDSDAGEPLSADIDGDSRTIGGQPDIGADEFGPCATSSTYTVATGDAVGLLKAVSCANENADANVITLGGGTYTLTAEDVSSNDSAFPTITTPITIIGEGSTLQRDASAPNFRFLSISGGGDLTLNELTLTGGSVSGSGGAINNSGGTVRLNRVRLVGNTSLSTNDGGGLNNSSGTAILIYSTVSDNSALRSGGIGNSGALTLINSTIAGNSSLSRGGGIHSTGGSSTTTVINTVITGNTATDNGGGMYLTGASTVLNSTIAGNTSNIAGGIHNNDRLTLTNSIVWGNSSQIFSNGSTLAVTYSLVEGGFTGTGNLNADPLFVDPIAHTSAPTTNGNYELQDGSPAINVGNDAALPVDTYDLDGDFDTAEALPVDVVGNSRVFNLVVDMGAYESVAALSRLTNGGFETAGATTVRALKWTNTKTKTADKRLCSKVSKPITTTEGLCVFNFSGGNTSDAATRGIKQVINAPSWGSFGGDLMISTMVEGNKFKTGAKLIMTVTYADATTGKVIILIPSGTYAFTEVSDTLTLTQAVTKVVVNFKVGKTGGRLRIDDVNLYLTTQARAVTPSVRDGASALSLPEALDGFRGGN